MPAATPRSAATGPCRRWAASGLSAFAITYHLNKPIACQPTRGIDVGSIEYIHERIVALRDAGVAVLVVSTELDEVMALADRVLVMYRGRVVADLPRSSTDHNEVGLYMAGAKESAA